MCDYAEGVGELPYWGVGKVPRCTALLFFTCLYLLSHQMGQ